MFEKYIKHTNIDFSADKPGRMNTKYSNFTLHTDNTKRLCIVQVFEVDSLMTKNNSAAQDKRTEHYNQVHTARVQVSIKENSAHQQL